jgi:hypothetical protein
MHSPLLSILAWSALALPLRAAPEQSAPGGDIEVTETLGPGEQSGSAYAEVIIHARREEIWPLITSCANAKQLVPGLEACEVLETAPDASWQRIRHVVDYSWYLPRLIYEFRATYLYPERVSIERVAGDLRVLRGSWQLKSAGGDTNARYAVDLAPGFWVPHWLVRVALKRDLPRMLRALKASAEAVHEHKPS